MENVIIIGSGPAAQTAAIYTGRANLNPVLFEGFMAGGIAAGGQLTTTTHVENFPGFPEGISGPLLMQKMKEQTLKNSVKIFTETVDSLEIINDNLFKIKTSDREIETKALIIATGATAKRMHLKNEDKLWQRGISACAVCDGGLPIFRNKPIAVIGGGDTAMEEAIYLTKFASKVFIIHRRDKLRASQIMQEKAKNNNKIEFIWDTVLEELLGENRLEGIQVKNLKTLKVDKVDVKGLFYAIGHQPNTAFLNNSVNLDDDGYIIVKPTSTETSVNGIFACGDVIDKRYRQAIVAAGSGAMAAIDVEKYLLGA